MSRRLISHNSDLQRLQNDGYEVEVKGGFLIINSVPYVSSQREIKFGTLVTDLTLSGEKTLRPADHQVWFAGDYPCKQDGSIISAIQHASSPQTLYDGIQVNHRFSCKPPEGYTDYYAKMTRYVEIIGSM